MKICIWWRTIDGPWGGGNAFFRGLAAEFTRRGIDVVHKPSPDCDAIVVNAWNIGPGKYNSQQMTKEVRSWGRSTLLGRVIPGGIWDRICQSKVPLIHRVDGVAELGRGTKSEVDPIQFSINSLCDLTVFQSEYSRSAFEQFNVVPEKWNIVHNGVDGSVFFPSDIRRLQEGPFRIAASSWSPNRNKGFAQLAQLSLIPGVEVHFMGQWNETIEPLKTVNHGSQRPADLAVILRDMDAFVHAGINEACSNSIVEALATGLPVMYVDSGANKELVGEFGIELTADLQGSVEKMVAGHDEIKTKLLNARDKFLISHSADGYLHAIELAQKLRRSAETRAEVQ